MNRAPLLAWHYTIGQYLPNIAGTGLLVPATSFIGVHERPVLWFSLNQRWEPTASKGIQIPGGRTRTATFAEMLVIGGGLVRFGIEPRMLLTGEALARAARINRKTWAGLGKVARAIGADPADWYGHPGSMSIEHLQIEVMEPGTTEWHPLEIGEPA